MLLLPLLCCVQLALNDSGYLVLLHQVFENIKGIVEGIKLLEEVKLSHVVNKEQLCLSKAGFGDEAVVFPLVQGFGTIALDELKQHAQVLQVRIQAVLVKGKR